MTKPSAAALAALDAIVDALLANWPKRKTSPANKREKWADRITKETKPSPDLR